ncbi:MAG: nucleotidyltransferase domain-containing protein [Phycisphaerae bacterium]
MVEARVRQAAELIKNFLKHRNIAVDKIVIFGSYTKGNYTKDSDLDIAVISQDFNGKDVFQKAEMLKGLKWTLVEKFELSFDIVPMSLKQWQESSSLVVDFIKEGEVLPL